MRYLKSKGQCIRIRASNWARIFYVQEFGEALDEALLRLQSMTDEQEVTEHLMQVIWSMNNTERMAVGKSTPTFDQWVEHYDGFDLNDCAGQLFDEINHGFMHEPTSGESGDGEKAGADLPFVIQCVALKIGLSDDALNRMTTQSILNLFNAYAAKDEKSGGTQEKRLATPAEIDEIYG